jgi:hypothetical protein
MTHQIKESGIIENVKPDKKIYTEPIKRNLYLCFDDLNEIDESFKQHNEILIHANLDLNEKFQIKKITCEKENEMQEDNDGLCFFPVDGMMLQLIKQVQVWNLNNILIVVSSLVNSLKVYHTTLNISHGDINHYNFIYNATNLNKPILTKSDVSTILFDPRTDLSFYNTIFEPPEQLAFYLNADMDQRKLYAKQRDVYMLGIVMYYVVTLGDYILTGEKLENMYLDISIFGETITEIKTIISQLTLQDLICQIPGWVKEKSLAPYFFNKRIEIENHFSHKIVNDLNIEQVKWDECIEDFKDVVFSCIEPNVLNRPNLNQIEKAMEIVLEKYKKVCPQ